MLWEKISKQMIHFIKTFCENSDMLSIKWKKRFLIWGTSGYLLCETSSIWSFFFKEIENDMGIYYQKTFRDAKWVKFWGNDVINNFHDNEDKSEKTKSITLAHSWDSIIKAQTTVSRIIYLDSKISQLTNKFRQIIQKPKRLDWDLVWQRKKSQKIDKGEDCDKSAK